MAAPIIQGQELSLEVVARDAHARRYLSALEANSVPTRRLLDLLNQPENEQRLVDASLEGRPALSGVVRVIESDSAISPALVGTAGRRFRQAVGVAVRLKMDQLGWVPADRPSSVRGSQHFARAERYEPAEVETYADRAVEGLDAIAELGTEADRAETAQELMAALAETRAAEGRGF